MHFTLQFIVNSKRYDKTIKVRVNFSESDEKSLNKRPEEPEFMI